MCHGHSHSKNEPTKKPHSHSHAHAHSAASGAHSHHGHDEEEDEAENGDHDDHHDDVHTNENMHGIFLHVLADALGSVGVITSSLLIQYKGWFIADPICSFFISVLIFLSVVPLLKSTATSLMLRVPSEAERRFDSILERCKRKQGVVRIGQAHLWRHSKDVVVATANVVVVSKEFQDPVMAWLVAAFKSQVGATDVTVQVCTEAVNREL